MKVSLEWMRDYVAVPKEGVQELADTLTQAGIPVEEVIHIAEGLKKVYTCKITKIDEHPNADALVVCQLDCIETDGSSKTRQICTSATNVKVGQIVPVAYSKAKLPSGQKISRGKMRGVVSDGMMCSIPELGYTSDVILPEDMDGIYILPPETPIGLDIKDVMSLDDVVFEFELTPNRADCFSMLGISREIAVLTNSEAKMPEVTVKENGESIEGQVDIDIEAKDLCSRFATRLVKNVKIAPSPLWMQNRLRNAGIRPINNIVDVTNYVMIEMGQPMHAYDYDLVKGHSLVVRRAQEGETLVTLDEVEHKLTPEMLIIADAEKPVAVAGIMGGAETEVTNDTVNVLFEAGVFNGKSIRRSARALGTRTEASGRFEKGVNADMTVMALNRAAQLLEEMSGDMAVAKGVKDVYPEPKEARTVSFTAEEINVHLGTDIPAETMVSILETLDFAIEQNGDTYVATIPLWRDDVAYMCDIAEEVARIYGYDNIVPTTPVANLLGGKKLPMRSLMQEVTNYFVTAGLSECITFSFMHKNSLKTLGIPEDDSRYMAVPILNPISEEFPDMRTTLVPSILETARKNRAQKNTDLALFEVAAVYEPKELPITDYVFHHQMACGLMSGNADEPTWSGEKRQVDFYDVKGVLEGLFASLGIEKYEIQRASETYLHPGVSAAYLVDGKKVAVFGEVHPKVVKAYNLAKETFIFEVDLQAILETARKGIQYKDISKFPGVNRDLAVVAPKTLPCADIEAMIRQRGGKLLQTVRLFDVYEGQHIAKDFRSLAYNLYFQAMDHTLEEQEVESAIKKMLHGLNSLGCTLR